MPLHRFVDPAYFLGVGASFPGTLFGAAYDRINVISGGAGGSGSANADVVKASGPNVGTYFMAFGEDATSQHFNRANKALAENTDYLDDVVHRDLATRTLVVVGSVGDTSTDLDGSITPVFVGNAGAVDALTFVLTEYPGLGPVYDPTTGARIVVSSITGATIGTGFSTANPITLNFNGTIPNGVNYIVWYGERKNLATFDSDLVADLLPAHSDPADVIGTILRGGLNARYRNATAASAAALDVPGAGGTIIRDGYAPTVDAQSPNLFDDPIGACWKAIATYDAGSGFPLGEVSGLGFVQYAGDRSSNESQEQGAPPSIGCFASVWPHDHVGDFAGTPRTQVNPSRTAALNPGGSLATTVQLHASDFFYNGATESAVNCGYDLLEIVRASGDVEVYCITSLDTGNARRCKVATLSGSFPTFGADEAVTCRWITTKFWQGPSTGAKYDFITAGGTDVCFLGSLLHLASPRNQSVSPISESYPIFQAPSRANGASALLWAGFEVDASTGYPGMIPNLVAANRSGALRGDGSISTSGLNDLGTTAFKSQEMTAAVTGSQQWDLDVKPYLLINVTADAKTLTLTLPATVESTNGMKCQVVVKLGAAVSTFTLVWPSGGSAEFFFSSAGDKTPTQGNNSVTVYEGLSIGPADYYMTKTSFPAGGVQGP